MERDLWAHLGQSPCSSTDTESTLSRTDQIQMASEQLHRKDSSPSLLDLRYCSVTSTVKCCLTFRWHLLNPSLYSMPLVLNCILTSSFHIHWTDSPQALSSLDSRVSSPSAFLSGEVFQSLRHFSGPTLAYLQNIRVSCLGGQGRTGHSTGAASPMPSGRITSLLKPSRQHEHTADSQPPGCLPTSTPRTFPEKLCSAEVDTNID